MTDDVLFGFTETTFVERVWFVSWADTDWMCVVHRDGPDAPWRGTYRFRYYASAEEFDPNDRKNAYDVTLGDPADLDRLMAFFDRAADTLATTQQGDQWVVPVHADIWAAIRLLQAQEWFHFRMIAPGPEGPQ